MKLNPEDLEHARQDVARRWLRRNLHVDHSQHRRTSLVRRAKEFVRSNVHTVGIGPKIVEGKPTRDIAVHVLVVQKFAAGLLPKAAQVPSQIAGIPTDVIEGGVFRAAAGPTAVSTCPPPRSRHRPLEPGSSAANSRVLAGTIGWFCRSTRAGDPPDGRYLLSCRHVLAPSGDPDVGMKIYQPSPNDGATNDDWVARVARCSRLHPGTRRTHPVDAAIALIRPEVPLDTTLCSLGHIGGTTAATTGMEVVKVGRTTAFTTGVVGSVNCEAVVPIEEGGQALFCDQIRVAGSIADPVFALGGDSGALVVERASRSAVGLLFATTTKGDAALLSSIDAVLEDLEISLL